ncbi:MAG TPA: hypothetical protein HPP51_05425, partial [Planctomycetes bacterium]|nr:hypothetical protein [Planctomycetota bacterium]
MRKRVLLIIYLLLPIVVAAQDTVSFNRLPVAVSRNLADQLPVVQGDSTVRMTITLLNQYLVDSISVHRDSLDSQNSRIATLEADLPYDTTYLYNTRLYGISDSVLTNYQSIMVNNNSIGTLRDTVISEMDSTTAHRSLLDNLSDSITTHRNEIDALSDSITWLSDSVDVFSPLIHAHADSITQHRAELDILDDSATSQDTRLDALESATTDHGDLTGLSGDDHTQYLNTSRANSWFVTKSHGDLLNSGDSSHAVLDAHLIDTDNPHSVNGYDVLPDTTSNDGKYLSFDSGSGFTWSAVAGGG